LPEHAYRVIVQHLDLLQLPLVIDFGHRNALDVDQPAVRLNRDLFTLATPDGLPWDWRCPPRCQFRKETVGGVFRTGDLECHPGQPVKVAQCSVYCFGGLITQPSHNIDVKPESLFRF
jgi:hypothetical protein